MPNDKNHNSGNFAQDRDKASRAGQQGGQSSSNTGFGSENGPDPREAGRQSHKNDNQNNR